MDTENYQVADVHVSFDNTVEIRKDNGDRIVVSGFPNQHLAEVFADMGDFRQVDNNFCELYGLTLIFSS